MKFGISTSCMYARRYTEDALRAFGAAGVRTAEVFLNCASEYEEPFARLCAERAQEGGVRVCSVHAMTTQFEPQLFSALDRQREDAMRSFRAVCRAGEIMGAGLYVFHGALRISGRPRKEIDYDAFAERTEPLIACAAEHGLMLAWETVHYSTFDTPHFAREMRARLPELRYTFDAKQAHFSGVGPAEYIDAMGNRLCHVHVCDWDETGRTCLPGKGVHDFARLCALLRAAEYDGAMILETYPGDYEEEGELFSALRQVAKAAAPLPRVKLR